MNARQLLIAFACQIWLFSGLLINLIQILVWVLVKPWNRNLFRQLNYYLTYAIWSQLVFILEYLANSGVRVYFADEITERQFNAGPTCGPACGANCVVHNQSDNPLRHLIGVYNHAYELDWLWSWLLFDKVGCLANVKCIAKRSLSYVPIMGWSAYLSETIFLSRDWSRDQPVLLESIDRLMTFNDRWALMVTCEGTRFTLEKYEASRQYAKEKNLPTFKHHLVPRTKGFVNIVKHLHSTGKVPTIYNLQLAFSDKLNEGFQATTRNLMAGRSVTGDLYIERVDLSKIDLTNDEALSRALYRIYRMKDELIDYHDEHGHFPGIQHKYRRRLAPILNFTCWSLIVLYCMTKIALSSVFGFLIAALLMGSSFYAFTVMSRSAQIKHGSSYGINNMKSD